MADVEVGKSYRIDFDGVNGYAFWYYKTTRQGTMLKATDVVVVEDVQPDDSIGEETANGHVLNRSLITGYMPTRFLIPVAE